MMLIIYLELYNIWTLLLFKFYIIYIYILDVKSMSLSILLIALFIVFRFQWAIIEALVLQITLVVHLPLLFLIVFPPLVLRVLAQILHWVITPLMIPQTIMFNSSTSRQVHCSINLNNSRWWVIFNCVNASSW